MMNTAAPAPRLHMIWLCCASDKWLHRLPLKLQPAKAAALSPSAALTVVGESVAVEMAGVLCGCQAGCCRSRKKKRKSKKKGKKNAKKNKKGQL